MTSAIRNSLSRDVTVTIRLELAANPAAFGAGQGHEAQGIEPRLELSPNPGEDFVRLAQEKASLEAEQDKALASALRQRNITLPEDETDATEASGNEVESRQCSPRLLLAT